MRLPRARPLREPEERDAPASSRRLHCRTARPPGTHGACPAPRALPGANPFPAGPQLRSPGVGGGVGRAGGAPEPRGLTRVVLQRCWRPGMPALPEPGLREGGGNQGILEWFGVGKSSRSNPCHGQGASTTRVTFRAAAVPVPGSAAFMSTHFGMVKRLPGPALTSQKCWELPRCSSSPSKHAPRSWDRAGDSGGTPVTPTPATTVSPTGPTLAGSGHLKPIPREFQPWFGPSPWAVGMPGVGQTQGPSQDGNVEVRGVQGVLVPLTATQE